jgi:hypothetical protein
MGYWSLLVYHGILTCQVCCKDIWRPDLYRLQVLCTPDSLTRAIEQPRFLNKQISKFHVQLSKVLALQSIP